MRKYLSWDVIVALGLIAYLVVLVIATPIGNAKIARRYAETVAAEHPHLDEEEVYAQTLDSFRFFDDRVQLYGAIAVGAFAAIALVRVGLKWRRERQVTQSVGSEHREE